MTATIITLPVGETTTWQDHAECRGYPTDWWFPEKTDGPAGYTRARQVCATCPAAADCLEHALHEPETKGMWAGRTPQQLVALRRQRGIRTGADHG